MYVICIYPFDAALEEPFIRAEGYSLYHVMNALEIMNPSMDGSVNYPASLIPEKDRVDASESVLLSELSAVDVCWVADRLMACEVRCG